MTDQQEPAKAAKGTGYVVLVETEDAGEKTWMVVDTVDAASAIAAIKTATNQPGWYVAVPTRSWQPKRLTADTRTVLTVK